MREHRENMQSAATATGNGTSLCCTGHATAAMQVSGTFVGTVTFEATINGSTWVSLLVTNVTTGGTATSTNAAGIFRVSCGGFAEIRARISAYTSGSITVHGRVTEASL